MAKTIIDIDFRTITDHLDLVYLLSPAFQAKVGEDVEMQINLSSDTILYSDMLLLIASTVKYLRNLGVHVVGNLLGLDYSKEKTRFASRVDFFLHIGAIVPEYFQRHNPSGRFTEIINFVSENALNFHRKIVQILFENGVNDEMLRVLDYCLWEVIDNTLNHSVTGFQIGKGSGFLCCQYFPKRQEIRLMIADNGIGIHQALTTHPNSVHQNLSEQEAIEKCIERGVTNSTGMGFGLWATSTLVRENKGTLMIHSGAHSLLHAIKQEVKSAPFWQGTYTFLRLNTDIPVTYEAIFNSDSQRNNFEELKEDLLDNLEELW